MYTGLSYASIKDAQEATQKCITWPKISSKGRQAWDKAWIDFGLRPKKLNMPWKKSKTPNFFYFFFEFKIEMYFVWLNNFLIFFLIHYRFANLALLF
jgi:hypothetical protein